MTRDVQADAGLLHGEAHGTSILCPGPNHSRSDRSLSLHRSVKSPIGYWLKSFSGDSFERCSDHIRHKLGLPEFKPGSYRPPTPKPDPEPESDIPNENIERARAIWQQGVPVTGTLGERYLYSERGLRLEGSGYFSGSHYSPPKKNTKECQPGFDYDLKGGKRYWRKTWYEHPATLDHSHVLRFHPRLYLDGSTVPGLVALLRHAETKEPTGIHRTFLSRGGHKITRRNLGPSKNAAIMLDEIDGAALCVGEGLESTLAGRALGFRPAWSLGSAGAIASFPPIDGVETLRIFAENDGGASEDAIAACRKTWLAAGRRVLAIRPPAMFKDLNNFWLSLDAQPHEERKESFFDICQRFWPGCSPASDPINEQESVLAMLREIGGY
jgi:putative DNA primase/helicase